MSRNFKCFGAAALAACLISGGAQASNLLTDGSFESDAGFHEGGHVGDEQLLHGSTALPGWTVVGVGAVGWFSATNGYDITASDGSYSLDLTGDTDGNGGFGGVQQKVSTVVGQLYTLTFDLGTDAQYGVPASITASAGDNSQQFSSLLTNLNDANANAWTHETFTFTATGTTTTVTLQGSQGRSYIGLDKVALDGPAGTPGVPEPAAWALMIVGFGGAGGLLRRKRAATSRLMA